MEDKEQKQKSRYKKKDFERLNRKIELRISEELFIRLNDKLIKEDKTVSKLLRDLIDLYTSL